MPPTPRRRCVVLGLRHCDARHGEQKTRIDAVIARLDAFAREETAARPFARRIVAGAAAQQIDEATDDLGRIFPLFSRQPGRLSRRADFDAFAAARAGVDHGVDAPVQCQFEGRHHGHIVMPIGARLKGPPDRRNKDEASPRKGKSPAKRLLKARILLKADVSEAGEGWSDSWIMQALDTSASMTTGYASSNNRPTPGGRSFGRRLDMRRVAAVGMIVDL